MAVGDIASAARFGVATLTKSGLPIPEDIPVEKQILLLIRRIEDVEETARIDRERAGRDVRHDHQ